MMVAAAQWQICALSALELAKCGSFEDVLDLLLGELAAATGMGGDLETQGHQDQHAWCQSPTPGR